MKRIKVFTNESFERYIDTLSKNIKFEGRWDDLDLDDVAADIEVPTQSEVNAAVRELDLFDDLAAEVGATDVGPGPDGKLRILDIDDDKVQTSKNSDKADARTKGLDLDDKPKGNKRSKEVDIADELPVIGDLDYDDKGAEVRQKKSNVGALGALDYDGDIDTSKIAASIDDVYTCLSSEDPQTVKAIIKRYAPDITDEEKIKKALLAQATNLNLECLKVLCGDMRVALTAKEKGLGFIDREEIKQCLSRLKNIANKLNGENNEDGLIPTAIVSCSPKDQTQCINIIDFLATWCNLPIIPLYFRGAMIRHCYQLARFLLDKLKGKLPYDILIDNPVTGSKGLITRLRQLDDVPLPLFNDIVDEITSNNKLSFQLLGDIVISCIKNKSKKQVKKILDSVSENKAQMIRDYVEDNEEVVSKKLEKIK